MTDKAPVCCINGANASRRPACVPRRDRPTPYGDVAMTLSVVLRIKRQLDGFEIDEITDLQARKALAAERRRRADWHRRELSARRFQAE